MKKSSVRLNIEGKELELPVYTPTEGADVIDIAELTSQGYFTYDPGFVSTAMCESAITYIDGDKGILRHRGYSIEDLAANAIFLELCYLLLNDELPTAGERDAFVEELHSEAEVAPFLYELLSTFPRDAHPMGILCSLVASMAAHYHADIDILDPEVRHSICISLIAKMPTLATMIYRHSRGQGMLTPRVNEGYATNFLHLLFSKEAKDIGSVNQVLAKAMDRIFLLHADHEQNASTTAVRMTGSTDANPYACIAAGIAALWGPAHGGANEAVLRMLDEIGDPSNIGKFIERAKDRNDPFRIMGFGHRVYKNYDPRAQILQNTCNEVLELLGVKDNSTLQMARELEHVALNDDYFIERRLYPNVDFYSGIILKALGIPTDMFTVIFAVGRTPGWIAQWNEMHSKGYKISRPRQLYTGEAPREYPVSRTLTV